MGRWPLGCPYEYTDICYCWILQTLIWRLWRCFRCMCHMHCPLICTLHKMLFVWLPIHSVTDRFGLCLLLLVIVLNTESLSESCELPVTQSHARISLSKVIVQWSKVLWFAARCRQIVFPHRPAWRHGTFRATNWAYMTQSANVSCRARSPSSYL